MTDASDTQTGEADARATAAMQSDLLSRLRHARQQESAARAEMRSLDRELALARRLVGFFAELGDVATCRTQAPALMEPVLVSAKLAYHLDRCERAGSCVVISGWAFRPAQGWDARRTEITLILRHDDTVFAVSCTRTARPDLTAHFARQPAAARGGATGIEGAGFHCEFETDTVPPGEWRMMLRLECGTGACEQFTGTTLRL